MLRLLIPVILLGIIALVVLVIHKRESKVGELKRLRRENATLLTLVNTIDEQAQSEYTVTHNLFAGSVLDAIRRNKITGISS